jgi:precorrin-4/cobalt-precorrin-4 C11-methyltransferase
MRAAPVERTALILVGPALGADDFRESELYNPDYVRRFRAGDRRGEEE